MHARSRERGGLAELRLRFQLRLREVSPSAEETRGRRHPRRPHGFISNAGALSSARKRGQPPPRHHRGSRARASRACLRPGPFPGVRVPGARLGAIHGILFWRSPAIARHRLARNWFAALGGCSPGLQGAGGAHASSQLGGRLGEEEKQVAFGAKALAPPLIFMEIKKAGWSRSPCLSPPPGLRHSPLLPAPRVCQVFQLIISSSFKAQSVTVICLCGAPGTASQPSGRSAAHGPRPRDPARGRR